MNSLRIGISQSNYVPWLGYFELISKCDVFVFLESVQYTKNDWRNRNIIRTNDRPHWLTVPVSTGNSMNLKLNNVKVSDANWSQRHRKILQTAYGKKLAQLNYGDLFEQIYNEELQELMKISEINIYILKKLLSILRINTRIVIYNEVDALDKELRVLKICQSLKANTYITTEKGSSYINKENFHNLGIDLEVIKFQKSIDFLSRKESMKPSTRFSILDSISNYRVSEIIGVLS